MPTAWKPPKQEPAPSLWQCLPCPKCGKKSYAVPWEPQTVCSCGAKPEVVEVYLPFGPVNSR